MTGKHTKEFTLSLYGSLALFYFATLLLTMNALEWNLINAMEVKSFALSFFARISGGVCSTIIFFLVLVKHSLAPIISWLFVFCVALVVGIDVLEQGNNGFIWVVSVIMVLMHVMGAISCQKVVQA